VATSVSAISVAAGSVAANSAMKGRRFSIGTPADEFLPRDYHKFQIVLEALPIANSN
jgi:hypothetical protein